MLKVTPMPHAFVHTRAASAALSEPPSSHRETIMHVQRRGSVMLGSLGVDGAGRGRRPLAAKRDTRWALRERSRTGLIAYPAHEQHLARRERVHAAWPLATTCTPTAVVERYLASSTVPYRSRGPVMKTFSSRP